jgi:galactokinase
VGAVTRAFRAPGRVNLIGDHTDYNEGFVLPLAIDRECVVRWEPAEDGVSASSADGPPGWERYVGGVARSLAERGWPATPVHASVTSNVPIGAGLSSSAALEVALALALCDAAGFELPPLELALACRRAEQLATGVPTGIMDQLASIFGRRGRALLIDCRSLEVRPVPLPDGLAVLAVHSGVTRSLEGTAYAERRAACEAAAARLRLRSLRDATPEQVAADPRARHVVSENARVLAAAAALEAGDVETLGRLLGESHASLRDDYEVSTPELDLLVEALTGAGAYGARLTGAGFGGCVVALAPEADTGEVSAAATARYRAETGLEPQSFVCRAADGAGPV